MEHFMKQVNMNEMMGEGDINVPGCDTSKISPFRPVAKRQKLNDENTDNVKAPLDFGPSAFSLKST